VSFYGGSKACIACPGLGGLQLLLTAAARVLGGLSGSRSDREVMALEKKWEAMQCSYGLVAGADQ